MNKKHPRACFIILSNMLLSAAMKFGGTCAASVDAVAPHFQLHFYPTFSRELFLSFFAAKPTHDTLYNSQFKSIDVVEFLLVVVWCRQRALAEMRVGWMHRRRTCITL